MKKRKKSLERRNAAWWARIKQQERLGPQDSIARNLEAARRAYEAGNPFGLIDAVIFCAEMADHVALPRWALTALASEYVAQLKEEKLDKRMGRNASILGEHKQRQKDYSRFEAVNEALKRGLSLSDAIEKAVEFCEGTADECDTDAMRATYFRVKRMMKSNPSRFYLSLYSRYFVPFSGKS